MINVFHAFSGVDAQYMAEQNIFGKQNVSVVGRMEIDENAILSSALIHKSDIFFKKLKETWTPNTYMYAKQWLKERNIAYDFTKQKSKVDTMSDDKVKKLYIASVCTKNYGDITISNNKKLNKHIDIFTYSSPCQSFSVAGKQKGVLGVSGLLLECEKFINLNKPPILLLENVKNLVGKKFYKDFENWLGVLDSLGYNSYWKVLNAKDFGVPQNRERVFCVSVRKDLNKDFDFEQICNEVYENKTLDDIAERNVDEHYYEVSEGVKSVFKRDLEEIRKSDKDIYYCKVKSNFQNSRVCIKYSKTLTANNHSFYLLDKDTQMVRRFTPLEWWRLMGFKDEDFMKIQPYISEHQIKKQCGNSIVVPCLESIFKQLKIILK